LEGKITFSSIVGFLMVLTLEGCLVVFDFIFILLLFLILTTKFFGLSGDLK